MWFSLRDKHNSIKTVKPQAKQRRLNFKIVWFSWRENDILIKTYHATRGTCIATLQENPAARMQNMHQSEDLRAPLSSRLFKRIRQRECRTCLRTVVVQEACHRNFSRESGSENKNCKNWKNDMSTFDENPQTGTTTKNNRFWEGIVLLARKWYFFWNVWKSLGENKQKQADVVHLAQQ